MYNELYHHGIKGQKWGIRRFQNPDGSLTSAGKKRYGSSESFGARLRNSFAKRRQASAAKKAPMSDEDLKKAINRMQMEKTYNQLMSELHPKKKSRVKNFISDMMYYGLEKVTKGAIDAGTAKLFAKRKTADDYEKDELERLKRQRDLISVRKEIENLEKKKEKTETLNETLDKLRSGKTTVRDMSQSDIKKVTNYLNDANLLERSLLKDDDRSSVEKARYDKWLKDHDVYNRRV